MTGDQGENGFVDIGALRQRHIGGYGIVGERSCR